MRATSTNSCSWAANMALSLLQLSRSISDAILRAQTQLFRCGVALLLAACASCAWAQASAVSVSYLRGKLPVAVDAIGVLGTDLFGDRVNMYNGAVSFEQTDIDIPGNSALPVSLVRSYSPRPWWGARGVLADWDLNTPRIEGTFSEQWGFVPADFTGPGARCSRFSAPPDATGGHSPARDFSSWEYWQGTNLVIPGKGSQEMLARNPAFTKTPGNAPVATYPIVTRGLWQISCLPTLLNGAGQGFMAVSPDGVRYEFNWVATRYTTSLRKGDAVLGRKDWMLMATKVTDRFGNTVTYTYDSANPLLLKKIESSDQRVINLTYAGGRLATASNGTGTWHYQYTPLGDLFRVIRPDGSSWTFDLRPMVYSEHVINEDYVDCDNPAAPPSGEYTGTMTHPSGATGKFKTRFVVQEKTFVPRVCTYHPDTGTMHTNGSIYPLSTYNQALVEKTITGPGLPLLKWTYSVSSQFTGGWAPCTGCPDRKINVMVDPAGNQTRYHYGIRWRVNEGQLLRLEEGWNGSSALKSTEYRYWGGSPTAYPRYFGNSVNFQSDQVSYLNLPQELQEISQQGVKFTWRVQAGISGFDDLARPRQVSKQSTLGYAKEESISYHDNTALWVLGQVASITDNMGRVPTRTEFHPNALPSATYKFGRLVEQLEYQGNGLLHQRFDSGGRLTVYSDHYRGVPRSVRHPDGTEERALVSPLGNITRYTNEVNTSTDYAYDAMGRLIRVDYPSEPGLNYHPTTITYEHQTGSAFGLGPGHWRQTIHTGHSHHIRWFDALWRLRLERRWAPDDGYNGNNSNSVVEYRYDHAGRKTFAAYPQRANAAIDRPIEQEQVPPFSSHTFGTEWTYDALGRETQKRQASELGSLVTHTAYLGNFERRVTNPRGHSTTFRFQAFESPSEDNISVILAPESLRVDINRNPYGQPDSIVRRGLNAQGQAQHISRTYSYDQHMRLCKTLEPESGATVQAYDASGNVAWRASGLFLAGGSCADGIDAGTRKVHFGYDLRDRLTTTSYADGSQNITRAYWPDGLLKQIVAHGGGVNTIRWDYNYNNRRLLTTELYNWGNPSDSWTFTRHIDAHGNVSGQGDPWGTVWYSPDAQGSPRQVSGYASDVTYHPNGMLAGYTLNNGVTHSVTQNARGLPWLWRHAGVSQDRYAYDGNGNVTSITDELHGHHRSMPVYDGLDRLRQANGPWGTGSFTYDAVDNLVASTVGGRNLVHAYDLNNRLVGLSGSQNIAIGYDPNGNITSRGTQAFVFDIGNRMRQAVNKATYAYDGHGRRSLVWYTGGGYAHDAYTLDGKLRVGAGRSGGYKRYVHLRDKLIAETSSTGVTTYSHTDALGSPVAKTNSSGGVVSRTRYEPYGATVAGSDNPVRIGFTGHVNDVETGLVYMQQRYYDPIAGRFLSVDPVTTNAENGSFFNRYVYALNNPFGYVDPTGMAPVTCGSAGAGTCTSTGSLSGGDDARGSGYSVGASTGRPASNTVEGQVQGVSGALSNNGRLDGEGTTAELAVNTLSLASGLGVVRFGAAKGASAYSVAFETAIPKLGLGTRPEHFKAANSALESAMKSDAKVRESGVRRKWGQVLPFATDSAILYPSPAPSA